MEKTDGGQPRVVRTGGSMYEAGCLGYVMLPLQGVRVSGDGPQGAALGWVRLALWAGMEGIEKSKVRSSWKI